MPSVATLMAYLRRPSCVCGSTGHRTLTDDGPAVCPAGMLRYGHIARDPNAFEDAVVADLWREHADVLDHVWVLWDVHISRVGSEYRVLKFFRLEWVWTAAWPSSDEVERIESALRVVA